MNGSFGRFADELLRLPPEQFSKRFETLTDRQLCAFVAIRTPQLTGFQEDVVLRELAKRDQTSLVLVGGSHAKCSEWREMGLLRRMAEWI